MKEESKTKMVVVTDSSVTIDGVIMSTVTGVKIELATRQVPRVHITMLAPRDRGGLQFAGDAHVSQSFEKATDTDPVAAMRLRVESVAHAVGARVEDIATDDRWTTFYVSVDGCIGRVMVLNDAAVSWSSSTDVKVAFAIGGISCQVSQRSIFEVNQ